MTKLDTTIDLDKVLGSLISKLDIHSQKEIILTMIGRSGKADKDFLLKVYMAHEDFTYYKKLLKALKNPKLYNFKSKEQIYELASREGFLL